MRPTKEIVSTNSTEEGGSGGVASAGMEICELLYCLCEIIGIVDVAVVNRCKLFTLGSTRVVLA